jgi:hypothetical protein
MAGSSRGSSDDLNQFSLRQISKMSVDDAKTYFTWSNLFAAMAASPETGIRTKYLAVKDIVKEEDDCKRCESWKEWAFNTSTLPRGTQRLSIRQG